MSSPLGGSLIASYYQHKKYQSLKSMRKALTVSIELHRDNVNLLTSSAKVHTETQTNLQSAKANVLLTPIELSDGLIQLRIDMSIIDNKSTTPKMMSQILTVQAGESLSSLVEGNLNTKVTVYVSMESG